MRAGPAFARMADVDLAGRRVLVRADLNVPLAGGAVANAARIRASVPTFEQALAAGAAVTVVSHLGRPAAGRFDPAFSMAPVAARLGEALGRAVPVAAGWPDEGPGPAPGEIVLGENVRFLAGETGNDEALARRMAATCDVFVMDAFGTAHRAHASTAGVVRFAPESCAGPLLAAELDALGQALERPARPVVAVVGGPRWRARSSSSRTSPGRSTGSSSAGGSRTPSSPRRGSPSGRPSWTGSGSRSRRPSSRGRGPVREGSRSCSRSMSSSRRRSPRTRKGRSSRLARSATADLILDIGPESAGHLARIVGEAGTIIWNGPVGVFECPPFAAGTARLAEAVAASPAFSIAGGGDTLAAIETFGVEAGLSRISTGGGAFLEFLEGRTLPAVAELAAARQRIR